MPAVKDLAARGSSPHTRGLPPYHHLSSSSAGIIPAHAGFTACPWEDGSGRRDHPRTRGVYRGWPPPSWLPAGSSPHTRGLRGRVIGVTWPTGIIPAHAGFTHGPARRVMRVPDHPRTRGVYAAHAQPRIIPAHAGFTSAPCLRVGRLPDHPRTRGVYTSLSGTSRSVRGSSPHTRGLLAICPSGYCPRGIIPAHAGFTAPACGSVLCPAGSSPHTRGLRTVQDWLGMSLRIIPAHAGFTTPGGRRRAPPADHPRTRGVYVAE